MTTTIFAAYEVTEILMGDGVVISRNDAKFIADSLQKNNRFVYRCGRGKGEKVFEFITPAYIAPEDVDGITNKALSDALADVVIAQAYADYVRGLASVSPVARDY